jgi:hypothetical protein
MTKIRIDITCLAPIDKNAVEYTFTWEGTEENALRSNESFERACAEQGDHPEEMARGILHRLNELLALWCRFRPPPDDAPDPISGRKTLPPTPLTHAINLSLSASRA